MNLCYNCWVIKWCFTVPWSDSTQVKYSWREYSESKVIKEDEVQSAEVKFISLGLGSKKTSTWMKFQAWADLQMGPLKVLQPLLKKGMQGLWLEEAPRILSPTAFGKDGKFDRLNWSLLTHELLQLNRHRESKKSKGETSENYTSFISTCRERRGLMMFPVIWG